MAVLKMKQNYVYDLDEGFEVFLSNRKVDKDVSEDTIKSYKDHWRQFNIWYSGRNDLYILQSLNYY